MTGTGYGRPRPTSIRELTLVGAGTPMGELLRRYWHPVGLGGDATDAPKAVRVLGEDLILFRDRRGRPGLVYARCAHRGTTLYYGRVEERGIRCCYHGWLFDVEGHCLDDTSFRIYTAGRVRSPGEIASVRSRLNGKLWEALTPEEHQRFPGDYEAQVGQGPITFHSEENLVSSDRGVALVRRLLKEQLEALAEGRDPIGVSFDATAPPVPFEAGNFLIEGRHAS